MRTLRTWGVRLTFAAWAGSAFAAEMIEPDDYPNGAVLNGVSAVATLSTADTLNQPIVGFDVTAVNDEYAPTGERVLAHVGIPFFNDIRRLRMDFAAPVYAVQVEFGGSSIFDPEFGRLHAFNAAGELIAEIVSGPLQRFESQTLRIARPQGDIACAVGFMLPEDGSFGRWDRIVIQTAPCPEDLDGDGVVGLGDLAVLLAHFGQTGGTKPGDGDTDGDGDVDLQDLANLLGRFGEEC